jgi:hypothetical protein
MTRRLHHPVTHGVQLLCQLTAGLRHVGSDPCTGQNTFPSDAMNATAEAREALRLAGVPVPVTQRQDGTLWISL